MSQIKRKYTWKKEKEERSIATKLCHATRDVLPESVDLRPSCPAVYDQGDLGSCTANAWAFSYQFDEMKQQNKQVFAPSRIFIYYNERVLEGTTKEDDGAQVISGLETLKNVGACSESLCPYNIKKFAKKPAAKCYKQALQNKAIEGMSVQQNLTALQQTLAEGLPIVFGIVVYDSFESDSVASTGIVPLPDVKNEKELGGHCIAIVGYDNAKEWFICRNSWGYSWGMNGYFYLPYAFALDKDLASDFCILESVTNTNILNRDLEEKTESEDDIDTISESSSVSDAENIE